MAEEKFKIRPDLKSGIKEVDDYLNEIHDYVMNFDASNVKRLIIALDNVVGVMTDDIERISRGDIAEPDFTFVDEKTKKEKTIKGASKLELLGNDTIMSTITTMIKMIGDFSVVSDKAASLRPEIAESIKKQEIKLAEGNALEQLQEGKWNQRKK